MMNRNSFYLSFIGILAVCFASFFLCSCGSRAQKTFEEGKFAYETGDYPTAVKCFYEAAQKDHAEAQFYLGRCYMHGDGVKKSEVDAAKWYRKASDNGVSEATYNLATMLYMSDSGYMAPEGVRMLKQAAAQDNLHAYSMLGLLYASGNAGTEPRNAAEARRCFEKVIEMGDEDVKAAARTYMDALFL